MQAKLRNANYLSHEEFYSFSLSLLNITTFNTGTEKQIEDFRSLFMKYYDLLKACSSNAIWPILDEYEKRRYVLWEHISETIGDNLDISFSSEDLALLEQFDVDPLEALMKIPTFKASWDLVESDGSYHVAFDRRTEGYYWLPDEMEVLISNFLDEKNQSVCETAGIISFVDEMREVEKYIEMLSFRLENNDILNELRLTRFFMMHRIEHSGIASRFSAKRPRDFKFVNARVLLADQLREKFEIDRMQTFSYDQLMLSEYPRFAKLWQEKLNELSLYPSFEKSLKRRLAEFIRIMNKFRNHELWEQFEAAENEFCRECYLLLDKVSSFCFSIDMGDTECTELLGESDQALAVSELLQFLDKKAEKLFYRWSPDCPIDYSLFQSVVQKWNNVECSANLLTIDALDLFGSVQILNCKVNMIATQIEHLDSRADLAALRHKRFRLSEMMGALQFIADHGTHDMKIKRTGSKAK